MVPATVDAVIWVAAAREEEPEHRSPRAVIAAVVSDDVPVHQPALTFTEVAGAVRRRSGSPEVAEAAVVTLSSMPTMVVHPSGLEEAMDAARLAAWMGLRGPDATYLAVARSTGSPLVTLDQELLDRSPPDVRVMTPERWLAARVPGPSPDADGKDLDEGGV